MAFSKGNLHIPPREVNLNPLLVRLPFADWYTSASTPMADGPSTPFYDGDTIRVAPRSSMIDSIRGCCLAGIRIDKEELRRKVVIPKYLRAAMLDAIRSKGFMVGAGSEECLDSVPEAPMVVFINTRSGGRHGPELMLRLHDLICEEQVFDLANLNPRDFVKYGLRCLEKMADHGDLCARDIRQKLRIVVAGGDGTVGWVLGCLTELSKQNRDPVPPTSIIPLGTGNDLSRSFGWGGSFPFAWKSSIKRMLNKACTGPICRLDSWQVLISLPSGNYLDPPHSLKKIEEQELDQGLEDEGELSEKMISYEGVFYNYFSIGMDAQVAYGFHHLRNEKPYLARGPLSNKLIYSGYTCTQGWFLTPCMSDPGLRGLRNILRIHVKKASCSEWELIRLPSSVRAVVALNLHNYASGTNPWGNLKPGYLEKRGFVEAHVDDGLLEIFGLKQGWHASFVMVELISAVHIAQAAALRIEMRGGEWKHAFLQMDGEPWKQQLNTNASSCVEIRRVHHQSLMVHGSV